MREHPIPQDITNYRFHIIGSMTLKQFGEIALGCVVGVILYNTNLIAVIKWPLIGISIAMGAAAAFVPIEERPLDHWIFTFFKVLYKPTQFYWKRTPQIPKAFLYTNTNATPVEQEVDLSPARRQRIKDYLTSVSKPDEDAFSLSAVEQSRVAEILSTFTTQQVVTTSAPVIQPTIQTEKPDLSVRVRKLRPVQQSETVIYNHTETNPSDTSGLEIPQADVVANASVPDPSPPLSTQSPLSPTAVEAPQVSIPVQEPIEVTAQLDLPTLPTEQAAPATFQPTVINVAQLTHSPNQNTADGVSFNSDLPFPTTPSEPNRVVGMVLTPDNDLISEAIVDIQAADGSVVRAVKTNALGQFFITTPLSAGEYTILVEKDGLSFAPHRLVVSNQIIQPMEIRSA